MSIRSRSTRTIVLWAVAMLFSTGSGHALEQGGSNFILDWLQGTTGAVDVGSPDSGGHAADGAVPEVQVKFLVNQCDSALEGPQDLFDDPLRVAKVMGVDVPHPPVIAPPLEREPLPVEVPTSLPPPISEAPVAVASIAPEPAFEDIPMPLARPDIPVVPVEPEPVRPVTPPPGPVAAADEVVAPAQPESAPAKVKIPEPPLRTRIGTSGSFITIEVGTTAQTAGASQTVETIDMTQTSLSVIYLD